MLEEQPEAWISKMKLLENRENWLGGEPLARKPAGGHPCWPLPQPYEIVASHTLPHSLLKVALSFLAGRVKRES